MATHWTVAGGASGLIGLAIEAALVLACAYALPSVIYCVSMLVAASAQKRRLRKLISAPSSGEPRTRFHVLVPAHDEARVIGGMLAQLVAVDYPRSHVRFTVVADNCGDDTAALARAVPGVAVLERCDPGARSKGFALNWAIQQILAEGDADAIVVVDADTLVDRAFLAAMDRAIAMCPTQYERDRFVAQGLYRVSNVEEHWRTALMSGALSLVHYVRPLARERWKTSVGLKGNGMCFARGVLEGRSWRGESITEDLEFGLDLIEQSGIRVRFVPGAIVEAQMPADVAAAAGQRLRWEGGRKMTVRRRVWPLLLTGFTRRDRLRLDGALDLLCPPLAQQAAALCVWAALIAAAAALRAPGWIVWSALWGLSAAGLAAYVIGGFKTADAPRAAYAALFAAPVFAVWKIAALLVGGTPEGWRRTERHSMAPAEKSGIGSAKGA